MNLLQTEEQAGFRSSIRTFLGDFLRGTKNGDQPAMPDRVEDLWRGAAARRLFGLSVGLESGGQGETLIDEMILFEELGRSLAPGPWLGSVVAAHALAFDTDPRRVELRDQIIAGALKVALVERPDASPLIIDAEGLVTGERDQIANANYADAFLLLDAAGVLLVRAGRSSTQVTPVYSLDATRPIARVAMRDAPCDLLSRDPAIAAALRRAATVLECASAVGGIERTLELAVDHARTREQFGLPIGAFQAVKHRLADMVMRLEKARSATIGAVLAVQEGLPDEDLQVSAAKVLCAEAFEKNAAENLQTHGALGYTWDCPAHLFVRRARVSELTLGTRTQQLDALVAALRPDPAVF